jgi:hypothetical protein
MNTTKFTELPQFVRGKSIEAYLDDYFRQRNFKIRQTTKEEERNLCLGDRQFFRDGKSFFVEYKSGIQTHYTGNIFLETISVDDPNHFKPGWVYTCKANFIIYATVLDGCLLMFIPDQLRKKMERLKLMFQEVATSNHQNTGYNTHGLIVPFEWAKQNLANRVIQLVSIGV